MTRDAQLQCCKVCVHHKKDLNLGIICGLSGAIADFESQCDDFKKDSSLKTRTSGSTWRNGIGTSQGQRLTNYLIGFICMLIFIVVIFRL